LVAVFEPEFSRHSKPEEKSQFILRIQRALQQERDLLPAGFAGYGVSFADEVHVTTFAHGRFYDFSGKQSIVADVVHETAVHA
jgi:hypothetical protein